jgi:broad-specificity NMP kinase
MNKVYFVSGVNGVGKSSLMPHLRELLPTDKYSVVDFDSRGVPDGADHAWRQEEVKHWVEEGVKATSAGKELIICGFVKPGDFEDTTPLEVKIIVLDADEETIRKRLTSRYTKDGIFDEEQKVIGKPVTEFIAGNVWYAKKMREESAADGLPIIDTSTLTPQEVARLVAEIVTHELSVQECTRILKEEFPYVYEWKDKPDTKYPLHTHKGKVSWFILVGSITLYFPGEEKKYLPITRVDIPVGVEHSAAVGSEGCTFIVGEEIEGDS